MSKQGAGAIASGLVSVIPNPIIRQIMAGFAEIFASYMIYKIWEDCKRIEINVGKAGKIELEK